ncbi:unnamed protein product [Blepharisma stoltei]|uniref:RING-type domain-containing protein n=1 Tax=Blepharisma stoltei TaxID=1481888 RepID=A0AAU9KIM7_9CILI|nr:unnamed protein product [Blepharisma stoltei]
MILSKFYLLKMKHLYSLLLGGAFCRLILIEPLALRQKYDEGVVPSVIANFGNPYISEDFEGSIGFLPDSEDPCSSLNSKYSSSIAIFINQANCDYALITYNIQQSGAGGAIFNSALNDTEIATKLISLSDGWDKSITIFAVMISGTHSDLWKSYKDNPIKVQFYSVISVSNSPNIEIGLTGDNILDAQFISKIYKFLVPLKIGEANIQIYFDYFSCQNCNANDCYADGKYCLKDSINSSTGKAMINQTLYEIILLNYVQRNNDYWGDFLAYLNAMTINCKNDYSDACSESVIHWLSADIKDIRTSIDYSWRKNHNDELWDNTVIDTQMAEKSNKNIWFTPSITVNSIAYLGDLSYFSQLFCESFFHHPSSCYGYCSDNCQLSGINNGNCEINCASEKCSNDVEDCKGTSTLCTEALRSNSVCDSVCNVTEYNYDNWLCVCRCNSTLLENDICDPECNSAICEYDNGDCSSTIVCHCSDDLLYNDVCDSDCNTPECNFDNYACKNETSSSGDDGLATWQIALIAEIAGSFVFVLIISFVVYYILYRRKKNARTMSDPEIDSLTINEIQQPDGAPPTHERHMIRLSSRRHWKSKVQDPQLVQEPCIINSDEEVVESNEESEFSKTEGRMENKIGVNSDLSYAFYGDPVCSICLDKITKKDKAITNCHHIFHKKCLSEWIVKAAKEPICPNCSKHLFEDNSLD